MPSTLPRFAFLAALAHASMLGAQAPAGSSAAPDVAMLQQQCNAGTAASCETLGLAYATGNGLPRDPSRAVPFLERGCGGQSLPSCFRLAYILALDTTVTRDVPKALRLYKLSCEQGMTASCNNLGIHALNGVGLPADTAAAVRWFQAACDGGNPYGCGNLANRFKRGEGVGRDLARAATLYRTACDAGYAPSCNWGERPASTSAPGQRTYNPVPHFGELGRFVGQRFVSNTIAVEFFTDADGSVLGLNMIKNDGMPAELWRVTRTATPGVFATSPTIAWNPSGGAASLEPDGSLKLLYTAQKAKWQVVYRPEGGEVAVQNSIIQRRGSLYHGTPDRLRPYTPEAHQAASAALSASVAENAERQREDEAAARERRAAGWAAVNRVLQGELAAAGSGSVTRPTSSSAGTLPASGSPATGQVAGGSPRPQPAAAAGGPLRFVLSISMRNLPGDKVNSTCYSGVITRQGPPGWGSPGFLPPGSGEQARETVLGLRDAFITACEASGRQISSAGNFNWVWNQMPGDDQKLAEARAKYREDVTVSVR